MKDNMIIKNDILERLTNLGPRSLSFEELIKILTNYSKDILLTENLAYDQFKNYSLLDFKNKLKFTTHESIKLVAAIEFGKRILSHELKKTKYLSPLDIYELLAASLEQLDREELWLVYLDNKLNIINYELVYSGLINNILFDPRLIFQKVILNNAKGFIMVHNHPSGESNPSYQDIEATLKIKEAARILNLLLVEHVIIGKNEFYAILKREKNYPKKGLFL